MPHPKTKKHSLGGRQFSDFKNCEESTHDLDLNPCPAVSALYYRLFLLRRANRKAVQLVREDELLRSFPRRRRRPLLPPSVRPSFPPFLFLCLPRCDTPRTQCEKQEGPLPPCAAGCFSAFHVTEEYLDDIESTLLSFHPPLLSALSFLVPSHFTANFQPLLEDFTSLPAGCWTSFLRGRAGSGEGASLARLSSFAAG